MNLQTAQQWASLIALIIGIGNAAWIWLSRPARDTNKRIDQVDERIDVLNGEVNDRADRHREELKAHAPRVAAYRAQYGVAAGAGDRVRQQ